jgi:hypothetical protein
MITKLTTLGIPKSAALFLLCAAIECVLAPSASAQLSLFTVQGGVQTPVGESSDFGAVANGDSADVVFRLQYTGSAATYYLNYFSVAGTGFSIAATDWQSLPAAFPAGGYLDFTINFQPNNPGTQPENYSAVLLTYGTQGVDNVQVYLLGTGTPGLTLLLNNQPLAAGQTIGFGNVQVGSTGTVKLMLANQTTAALTVPAIQPLTGAAFSVAGAAVSRPSVAPGASAELDLVFTPTATGAQQATFTVGVLSYPLQGTGTAATPPILPQPSLQVNLPTVASAQQGSIAVNLAALSAANASGTVTLAFQPANGLSDDPTVTFSDGTGSASFTVAQGASTGQFGTGPSASFGTGTTAGTLVFTVVLGSNTAQTNVVIPTALIGIDAAVAARDVSCAPSEVYCTTTNIELQINGWDNTQTASTIVFNFYDSSGKVIAPANLSVAGTSAFQQYFATSSLGGVFSLDALFPVTGNADLIVSAVVQLTNSVGTAQTAKITF